VSGMPEGSNRDTFLAFLAEIHRARKSGTLRVSDGEVPRLTLELRRGDIVGLTGGDRVRGPEGDEDRELASLLEDAYFGGDPGLSRTAARQTVLEALTWAEARCAFEEGAPPGADPPLELSTGELLREAAHSVMGPDTIRAALGDLDRPLRLAFDPRASSGPALTPTESYVVSRVERSLSAREVLLSVPHSAPEAERSLFDLLAAGLVEYVPAAAPPPSAAPRAAEGESDSGRSQASTPRVPSKPAEGPRPPSSSNSPSGRSMTVEDAASLADDHIQRAESLTMAEQHWEVIQLLEPVLTGFTGKRKQRARLLLARAYAKNPKWLKRGERILQTILEDDPQNADAYFLLGTIYKAGGLQTRATGAFKKVLELQPGHKQAQDELQAVEPAPSPKKRWFGGPG
jgi:hypothetical protein